MSIFQRLGLTTSEEVKKEVVVEKPAIVSVANTGSADDELLKTIIENVKQKAVENPYFKLKTSMELMMANKLDECSATKGSAAVLGVNAQNAGSSIDQVIELVKAEQEGFIGSVYSSAKSKAVDLDQKATDLQAQINFLLEQVKQLSEDNIATQQEASKSHGDAETMKSTFDASAQKLINILTAEKQKLITYLS